MLVLFFGNATAIATADFLDARQTAFITAFATFAAAT